MSTLLTSTTRGLLQRQYGEYEEESDLLNTTTTAAYPTSTASRDLQSCLVGINEIEVITVGAFERYKNALKEVLERRAYNQQAILYAVAGTVMLVVFFSIMLYLNLVIPATFVWPGVSKLLVAIGLTGLFLGGALSCAKAYESFQRTQGFQNIGSIPDIVDSHNMLIYQVPSEHFAATGGLPLDHSLIAEEGLP